jgi:hypothetical protein
MNYFKLCLCYLLVLTLLQGCKSEPTVREESNLIHGRNLPTILDLMEYHDGQIVAQGSLDTKFSSGYGQLVYGDLEIKYSPMNRKAGDNAYCLILTINGDRIEVILPNAAHEGEPPLGG